LKARGYWQTAHNETLGADLVYPGAPYEFGEIRWRQGRNAPRLGQHSAEILRDYGYSNEEINAMVKAGAIHAE
jgi:benzylsuccinate CoA-transferase BbsE subunit/naphthyl-2-methylsuccinate CoA transferase subunit